MIHIFFPSENNRWQYQGGRGGWHSVILGQYTIYNLDLLTGGQTYWSEGSLYITTTIRTLVSENKTYQYQISQTQQQSNKEIIVLS